VARLIERGAEPALTITGGRYVALSGLPGVFDAQTGAWTAAVPARWFETRVFNLAELVRACAERAPAKPS
jgi:hypothetical protein